MFEWPVASCAAGLLPSVFDTVGQFVVGWGWTGGVGVGGGRGVAGHEEGVLKQQTKLCEHLSCSYNFTFTGV